MKRNPGVKKDNKPKTSMDKAIFPMETESNPRQSRNLKYLSKEASLNSASNSIVEQYAAPYALFLNATNAQMGLLGLVQHVANVLAQLPGANLTKHFSRKSIWIASQMAAKILLIPLVILPLILPNPVTIIIAILGLVSFFINLRKPGWISLLSDIVPKETRVSYLGKRNSLIGISGFAMTLLAGLLLASYGFTAIFFLSLLLGMLVIYYFSKVYEPPIRKTFHYNFNISSSIASMREALSINRSFVVLTSYMTYINFAVEMVVPFVVVYMLKDLHLSYAEFGIVVALGVISKVISSRYWGGMSERYGDRTLIAVTGILICFVPLGYILSSNVYQIALLRIYDGFVFAGFELFTFDYLLNITSEEKRPAYVGGHHLFSGIGAILGALAGIILVGMVETAAVGFMYGLQVLFLISFLLRLSATGFLPFIREIGSKAEGISFRYIFADAVALEPIRELKYSVGETFRVPYEASRMNISKLERFPSRPAVKEFEFSLSCSLVRLASWFRFKRIALKNLRRYSYRTGRELVR